ncbi:MAG: hypothetical protein J1E96_03865 [Ruminococcus sp.]|nr:hypothetical protein [Ruminococcus sp.]
MEITKFNDYESVENAIEKNEPLMAVISFDGSKAYVSHLDDGVEHHILLRKVGYSGTEIDEFFRIIFDKEGADWTFICPPTYKNIPYKSHRIKEFYKDGIRTISDFLAEMGYYCDIKIPKRYKRHFDIMIDE